MFFDKTYESMGLYNGKTTTTIPLLCSDTDSVDGETSGFCQPVIFRGFLKRSLIDNEVYFNFHSCMIFADRISF